MDSSDPVPPSVAASGAGEPDFRAEVVRLGRLLRLARGDRFSIEALARSAGVSAGLLSQVERGIGNPSFQTLGRIARALDLSMTDLFAVEAAAATGPDPGRTAPDGPADTASDDPEGLVRAGGRRRMLWPLEQLSWDVLTPAAFPGMTVLHTVVPPGFRDSFLYRDSHYDGWLFRLTLSGRLLAGVDDTTVELAAGDSLSCHSSRLKWVRNESDEPAVTLAVLAPGAM